MTLPRITAAIRISRFDGSGRPEGSFLVEAGSQSFVLTPSMKALLTALIDSDDLGRVRENIHRATGLTPSDAEITGAIARLPSTLFAAGAPPEQVDHPLYFRRILLTETQTARLAAACGWLCHRKIVLPVLVVGAGMLGWALGSDTPKAWDHAWGQAGALPAMGILLALAVSTLLHEIGHAATALRWGAAPGAIGFGFYAIFPVFYADVSRIWRLPPLQRAAVDAGGLYFQCLFLTVCSPLLLHPSTRETMHLLVIYQGWSMLHNLNPVFKMDGYWLVSDLFRLPNLHRRARACVLELVGVGQPDGGRHGGQMRLALLVYAALAGTYFCVLALSVPRWVSEYGWPELAGSARLWVEAGHLLFAGHWGESFPLLLRSTCRILAVGLPALLGIYWVARGLRGILRSIPFRRRGRDGPK